MQRTLIYLLAFTMFCKTASAASLDGIHWWEGEVQSAFDSAKETNKPLFLYWGAIWCPPCNQIKKTIFTRREFQEKMKLFLPIYLDGDTERAQIWGEKLKAKGYPTMIVFSPDGKEIMRMPTGLQVGQFNEILDEALQKMTPVAQVLEESLTASEVSDAAYRVLSYYSWGQDSFVNKSDAELEGAFKKLEAKIPARLSHEKSRLFMLWLSSAVSLTQDKESGFQLAAAQKEMADERLHEILKDRGLVVTNMEYLLYYAGDLVNALHPKQSPERTRLIAQWEKTMEWIERDETLSVDERISALIPALEFHKMERGKAELPRSSATR